MLRSLIVLMGVDYDQWLALTVVSLKLDLRVANFGALHYGNSGKSESIFRVWFLRLWVYLFMGGMIGSVVWINKNAFFSGTVFLTYTMLLTAMLVLVDFGAIVISPEDFAILAYQPVSSRTYFVARLTNLLVYSAFLTLTLGIIPVALFFFTSGFRPLLGLAAFVAALLSGTGTALTLLLFYTAILRLVHPKKLRRAISYIQLVASFLIYGGYIFLPRLVDAHRIKILTLDKSVWLFLLPSTWFASYLDLALGRWGVAEVAPAIVSFIVLGLLIAGARGKLALEYSDQLSASMALSEGPGKVSSTRPGWIFKRGEARAVALLVGNQFKHDQKFRLAVLSILPLTVLYLWMGLREGPLRDPFVSGAAGFGKSMLIYVAVLMFPTMLRQTLTNSDSYLASWIYYATPVERSQLVLWSKNFVFVYFVLPYLSAIGMVFLYFFRNPWHVLLHLTLLALLSHLFLQIAVFANSALPFSQPVRKAQRSSSFVGILLIAPMAAVALLYAFSRWIYPNIPLLLALLAGLAGFSWLLEQMVQMQVRAQCASLEYQG
jgi:hypothetical protein